MIIADSSSNDKGKFVTTQNFCENYLPQVFTSDDVNTAKNSCPIGAEACAISSSDDKYPLEFLFPNNAFDTKQSNNPKIGPTHQEVQTSLLWHFIPSQLDPNQAEAREEVIRRRHPVTYGRAEHAGGVHRRAAQMADCTKRIQSFMDNRALQGLRGSAVALACLGFFAESESPLIRCSFCLQEFNFILPRAGRSIPEPTFLLHRLIWEHTVANGPCPMVVPSKCDNIPLPVQKLSQYMKNLSSPQERNLIVGCQIPIPLWLPRINNVLQQISESSVVRDSVLSEEGYFIGFEPGKEPRPELDMVSYFELRAEFDYEPLCELTDMQTESAPDDILVDWEATVRSPLEYFCGLHPRFSQYISVEARISSFENGEWRLKSGKKLDPEVLSWAGFYYFGDQDNTRCHWCGLGLNGWNDNDDPWREHARFAPQCGYLIRYLGRHWIKQTLVEERKFLIARGYQHSSNDSETNRIKDLCINEWDSVPGNIYSFTAHLLKLLINEGELQAFALLIKIQF